MNTPREITIHPSVHKPRLILGADREMVIFLALISAIFVFALVTWWSIMLGVGLWVVGVALLVRMGKEDPQMRKAYLRHVRYQAFYPAKGALHLSEVRLRRGWR